MGAVPERLEASVRQCHVYVTWLCTATSHVAEGGERGGGAAEGVVSGPELRLHARQPSHMPTKAAPDASPAR